MIGDPGKARRVAAIGFQPLRQREKVGIVERLRAEAARERIESGRERIEQVTAEMCFRAPQRLRRALLRRFGQPPQALKRMARAART